MVLKNRISPLLSGAVAVGYNDCGFTTDEFLFDVGEYDAGSLNTAGMYHK